MAYGHYTYLVGVTRAYGPFLTPRTPKVPRIGLGPDSLLFGGPGAPSGGPPRAGPAGGKLSPPGDGGHLTDFVAN